MCLLIDLCRFLIVLDPGYCFSDKSALSLHALASNALMKDVAIWDLIYISMSPVKLDTCVKVYISLYKVRLMSIFQVFRLHVVKGDRLQEGNLTLLSIAIVMLLVGTINLNKSPSCIHLTQLHAIL